MPPTPMAATLIEPMMKTNSTRPLGIVLALCAAFLISGCGAKRAATTLTTDVPAAVEQPENSYYFYTEAQLHKKRGDTENAIAYLEQAIALDDASVFLKRELAALHMQRKDYNAALQVIEAVLAAHPADVDALDMYGRLTLILNETEKAKAAYEKIITVDPLREAVYTSLGRIYMNEKDFTNAQRVYRQLVDHFPGSFVGYFYIGKIHALQGEHREAEQAFNKSLMLEPDLVEPRFELIELLRKEQAHGQFVEIKEGETIGAISMRRYGRYDETVKAAVLAVNPLLENVDEIRSGQRVRFPDAERLEQGGRDRETDERILALYHDILDRHPDNVRAAIDLGLFYNEIGQKEQALEIMAQLGERSLTEKLVLTTIIQQYYEKKRYREVIRLLQQMQQGAPDSSDLKYVLGLALNEVGEKTAAIRVFGEVAADSRFYENAVVNITLIHQEREELDLAIDHLKRAVQQTGDNPEFYLFLGTLYEEKKSYDLAEKSLKRGLEIDADNPKLHFRLGVVYDKWGRKNDCIAAMKTVIRLDPNHANALNYLGYTYADLGRNLDEAEQLIKRALEQKPDDGYITDSLGWVYYKKGLFQQALEIIKKAVELVPEDPIILEHLGDVYLKLNDREKALEWYQRSLDHQKEDREGIEKKIRDLKDAKQPTP